MSAVDTMNNVHVGNFFGIPIYWIIEERELSYLTDNLDDDGKVINQYYLSVGGGSGEHPALVLNNDALVFRFLCNIEEMKEPDEGDSEEKRFDYDLFQKAQAIDEDDQYSVFMKLPSLSLMAIDEGFCFKRPVRDAVASIATYRDLHRRRLVSCP